MSVTDQYLKNNHEYASRFTGPRRAAPSQHLAIVTCMDSRMDVYAILGLRPGEANVIRNASRVITDDEIRSLAVSQRLLGTREIILIHHAECALLDISDDVVRRQIRTESGLKPTCPATSTAPSCASKPAATGPTVTPYAGSSTTSPPDA